MKTIFTTLNAKYIHTALALRWLYVASKDKHDVDFIEFTIKESNEDIVKRLIETGAEIITFGIYIWNVDRIADIIKQIKEVLPNTKIIIGGPEVSYEPDYFIENWPIDYIICGEGEFVMEELITNIENNEPILSPYVTTRNRKSTGIAQSPIEKLMALDSPYQLERDKDEQKHRLIYFETSRGCPYQCQYCLSSLEKGVRYFSQDYLKGQLIYLFNNEAKTIKFLDRTFNLNEAHTQFIFQLMIDLYNNKTECHFEIYADLLKDSLIEFLNTSVPPNYMRFEIGIQSTYEPTNLAVKRRQDFNKITSSVKKLQDGGRINLHLDLIAGLPFENYDRFKQSFNDVFNLKAQELQLGFLKMLRGTALRKQSNQYGYQYQQDAPYEIIKNDYLSKDDLFKIHLVEEMIERYWNSRRFINTFNLLFKDTYNYFDFFLHLGQFYDDHHFPYHGYQLDQLYLALYQYLIPIYPHILKSLLIDYYSQFKVKPKRFIEPTLNHELKKQFIKELLNNDSFLKINNLTTQDLYKYAYFELVDNTYLIIIYKNHQCTIIEYNKITSSHP